MKLSDADRRELVLKVAQSLADGINEVVPIVAKAVMRGDGEDEAESYSEYLTEFSNIASQGIATVVIDTMSDVADGTQDVALGQEVIGSFCRRVIITIISAASQRSMASGVDMRTWWIQELTRIQDILRQSIENDLPSAASSA